jgi:hypothetical protein
MRNEAVVTSTERLIVSAAPTKNEYIESAANLWKTIQRKKLLEAEISDLIDQVLSAGMHAVEAYHGTPHHKEAGHTPMEKVCMALDCQHWMDWGLTMPDGLCLHDLAHATGLSSEDVSIGIDEIETMCTRGYDKRLATRRISGITRWRLIPTNEAVDGW